MSRRALGSKLAAKLCIEGSRAHTHTRTPAESRPPSIQSDVVITLRRPHIRQVFAAVRPSEHFISRHPVDFTRLHSLSLSLRRSLTAYSFKVTCKCADRKEVKKNTKERKRNGKKRKRSERWNEERRAACSLSIFCRRRFCAAQCLRASVAVWRERALLSRNYRESFRHLANAVQGSAGGTMGRRGRARKGRVRTRVITQHHGPGSRRLFRAPGPEPRRLARASHMLPALNQRERTLGVTLSALNVRAPSTPRRACCGSIASPPQRARRKEG